MCAMCRHPPIKEFLKFVWGPDMLYLFVLSLVASWHFVKLSVICKSFSSPFLIHCPFQMHPGKRIPSLPLFKSCMSIHSRFVFLDVELPILQLKYSPFSLVLLSETIQGLGLGLCCGQAVCCQCHPICLSRSLSATCLLFSGFVCWFASGGGPDPVCPEKYICCAPPMDGADPSLAWMALCSEPL